MSKRIIYIIGMAMLLLTGCERKAPKGTDPFLLQFQMPEEFKANTYYANQKVYLKGSVQYEFTTDIMGMVTVETVVPGIYDIKRDVHGLTQRAHVITLFFGGRSQSVIHRHDKKR